MRILEIPEGKTEICNYEYNDCRDLEQVWIPDSVSKIGKHAFYNCRKLEKIRISGKLSEIEDGAFKNCHKLRYIQIDAGNHKTSCIKNIVADLSHEIVLSISYSDGSAKILIPGYNYDYEIDINSRVFHEVVYGSGDAYQRCVSKKEIDFEEYDFLFAVAKREEQEKTLLDLASYRLEYPYQLGSRQKETYISYLKKHASAYIIQKIRENNQKGLRFAAEYDLFLKEDMSQYLEIASKEKKLECMAYLMEYQNSNFILAEPDFTF
ncbi:MAG: leucine-rich repeat domain-containing protein [Lachnospiraceae bacterium]|nr:leucine-rich repeat domain-containing protein [Lachnospiraceae bacterium]